jgi:hypothetical protein
MREVLSLSILAAVTLMAGACGSAQRVNLTIPHAPFIALVDSADVVVDVAINCQRVQAGPDVTTQTVTAGALGAITRPVLIERRSNCPRDVQQAAMQSVLGRVDRGLASQGRRRVSNGGQRVAVNVTVEMATSVSSIERVTNADRCQAACRSDSCFRASVATEFMAHTAITGPPLPGYGAQSHTSGSLRSERRPGYGNSAFYCSESSARNHHRTPGPNEWIGAAQSVGSVGADPAFMAWNERLRVRLSDIGDYPRAAAAVEEENWVRAYDVLVAAMASKSDSSSAAYMAAAVAYMAGALEEALELASSATALSPSTNRYRELLQALNAAQRHAEISAMMR